MQCSELGDLSGALGAVVAALHTTYGRLGVEDRHLVHVPDPDALAGFDVHAPSI